MGNKEKNQILEIIATLREAQAKKLYEDCKEAALIVHDYIENLIGSESKATVLLKEYHAMLERMQYSELDECHLLNDQILKVEECIINDFDINPDSASNQEEIGKFFAIHGINLIKQTETGLIIEKDGIKVLLEVEHDLETFHLIYVQNEYRLIIPLERRYICIDAGMNLGFASLYFAKNPSIDMIFSYEPFEFIYHKAIRNISLNEHEISKKIVPVNAGLGLMDETRVIDQISVDWKDSNSSVTGSAVTHLDRIRDSSQNFMYDVPIDMLNAGNEVSKIIEKFPKHGIIMKIDVEGSEYEIFESLGSSIIENIDIFLVEYHLVEGKSVNDLITCLSKTHYIYYPCPILIGQGMIYAFKQGR